MNIKVPKSLHKRFRNALKNNGEFEADVINRAIREYVEEYEEDVIARKLLHGTDEEKNERQVPTILT